MSSIQTKQFNWVSRQPAWREMQYWRQKQKAYQNQADMVFASSSDLFSGAIANLGYGLAEIAAKRAASRIATQIETKTKPVVDKTA